MLKELVDRIAELAVKANGPRIIHADCEPAHCYGVAKPDGSIEWHSANPAYRQHHASDLSAIVAFMQEATPDFPCEIWYSRHEVCLFLDRQTRRDQVQLKLTPSKPIQRLQALEAKLTPFDQRQFLHLLRIDLAGAAPSLLPIVRCLNFRVNAEGAGNIQHGKSSVGKSLKAEMSGEAAIPEEVCLFVPVFDGFLNGRTFMVNCAIDIDAENQRLYLIPLPGAIEGAMRDAEAEIGRMLADQLKDSDTPILYGQA